MYIIHIGPLARFLKFLAKKPTHIAEKKECEIFFFNFLAEKWKIHKIFEKNPQDFWPTFLVDFIIEHTEGKLPSIESYSDSSFNKLDHVVINTNDADGFIDIYKDVFDIRLALDKVIEHWNSRMLFFRLNETTIEVVEKNNDKNALDNLWGLAWEVESIERAHKRLTQEGVEITDIKNGLKESNSVSEMPPTQIRINCK